MNKQEAIRILTEIRDEASESEIEAMQAVSDGICQGQAEEAIQSLPSVEPKRPKGEWIINPRIDAGRFEIKCSECGNTFIGCIGHMPNFCEYCGADMRGDTENE